MAIQALYRRWRPQRWEDFVGQEHIVRVMRNAIKANRLSHAYLFSGPRGTGKTTMARMIGRAVNCTHDDPAKHPCDECENCRAALDDRFLDIIEIDAASNTGVDDIRDLRDKINFAPGQGKMKVYIIDEVHMLSTAAFNALLKTLEEPPSHSMFILATTELQKIPATVLSRCQHHEFRRFPTTEISRYLQKICDTENFPYEPEALTLISRQSTGAMRDALSLLDQLSSTGDKLTLAMAQTILGVATSQAVVELIDAIAEKDPAAGLSILHAAMDSGTEPRQIARQAVEYLRWMLNLRMGANETVELPQESRSKIAEQAKRFSIERLVTLIQFFNQAVVDSRAGWNPGLDLEIALAQSCAEEKTAPAPQPSVVQPQPAQKQPPAVRVVDRPAGPHVETLPSPEELESEGMDEIAITSKVYIRKGNHPDPSVAKDEIIKNWSEIRGIIREYDPVLDALLSHAKVMDVKDGILTLSYSHDTAANNINSNGKLLLWTSAAITKVIGKNVGVRSATVRSAAGKTGNQSLVSAALELGGKLVNDKK